MNGDPCQQRNCSGIVEDGYCNVCGHADGRAASAREGKSFGRAATVGFSAPTASVLASTGTASITVSRHSKGSRRTTHSSSRSTRKALGAGLITLPELPSTEPELAVMADPTVPERKRFCSKCDAQLKREAGFCGKCGTKYNFVPSLKAGDIVAGQYEVKGPIAFGGFGWIYLGFDRVLARYVVLKGLLNTQDESAAAAAVAERQYLAAVKHPNIVGIYNFVQNGAEGFIVMEYVGGKTLKQIRQERGPLPAAEAVAYIHGILPAFAYLHRMGLVYCDFKPENVMVERDDVKLIDMGGVRRVNDLDGDIYGTMGYSAPEAVEGPTPASDLFTIGRTLAVLLADIRGFSKEHLFTLPSASDESAFASQESLYRALLKATAQSPDDRFQSADEMAEQLLGVLREIVAVETGAPRPAPSSWFGADLLSLDAGDEMTPTAPDHRHLPLPAPDIADPGAPTAANAAAIPDPGRRVAALRLACAQFPKSRELHLRFAAALSETGAHAEAVAALDKLGEEDPWDWRVPWFQARLKLAQFDNAAARKLFDQVYFDLPGEIAPKLALGLAAELTGDLDAAIKLYDLVSRTDPAYASAVFGLARCRQAKGDRRGAVEALNRIPQASALYARARVESARMLIRRNHAAPEAADLAEASAVAESLPLDGTGKYTLASEVLGTALDLVASRAVKPDQKLKLFGQPLEERQLRSALENSLRAMARLVNGGDRIRLVDEANRVRPRTLW